MILQVKSIVPEPDTGVSTLRPQSTIRILVRGLIIRQVRLVRGLGVRALVGRRTQV